MVLGLPQLPQTRRSPKFAPMKANWVVKKKRNEVKGASVEVTDEVVRRQIENAKNLLLNLNFRVREIAEETGFQSFTHFSRVFKNIVGQSPAKYREPLVAFGVRVAI